MPTSGSADLKAYVFLDPFNRPTSGVTAYTRLAGGVLRQLGVPSRTVARRPFESRCRFQERVARLVRATYRPEEVLVEAPESGAASLLLPPAYRVHVRLHCAKAIGQRYEGGTIDERELDEEVRVIRCAAMLSAPSRAVVRETRRFTALGPTRVFPNPIGFAGATGGGHRRDIDLLYLGRFQALKGVGFLPGLLALLPEAGHVVLAGPGAGDFARAAGLHRRVRTVEAPRGARKVALLRRSRVLVVPSLFESFSMVIGEALGHGVCSVTWSHTGVAEAVPAPLVRTAPPWNLAGFARQTSAALRDRAPEASAFASCAEAIDARFRAALRAIAGGLGPPVPEVAAFPDGPDFDDVPPIPAMAYWEASAMNHHPPATIRWRRKLRKLQRDPVAFFSDARVVRALVLPPGSPSSSTALAPIAQGAARLPPVPSDRGATDVAVREPDGSPTLLANFSITGRERIEIADMKPAELRFSSAFLLRAGDALARSVLEDAATQQDFVGFRERYLHLGTYVEADADPTLTAADLLNRIDVANKQRLARFQNLIVFDPPPVLVAALRSASPYSRVVVVISPDGRAKLGWLDPDKVDAVIAPADAVPAGGEAWRRILPYDDVADIPRALRAALHEAGSKYFNVLLPVWGGLDYKPDLLDFNTSRYDGLIELGDGGAHPMSRGDTFRTYLQNLTGSIRSLYLTEESLLRYRSLCEVVRQPSDLTPLLAYSLADGARYDVRA